MCLVPSVGYFTCVTSLTLPPKNADLSILVCDTFSGCANFSPAVCCLSAALSPHAVCLPAALSHLFIALPALTLLSAGSFVFHCSDLYSHRCFPSLCLDTFPFPYINQHFQGKEIENRLFVTISIVYNTRGTQQV